jgi:sugar/nucleoside kinase (ribokinase family)
MSGLVVVSGYASVDRTLLTSSLPARGETAIVHDARALRWGGCAPNVALWLRRLGVPAALVAWLGDDAEGRQYRSLLAEDGVDLRELQIGEGPSPRSWLAYDDAGDAVCFFHASGADNQRPGPALAELADEAEWLAVTVGAAELTRSLLELFAGRARLAWNVKADRRAFTPDLVERLVDAELVCLNERERGFVGEALRLGRPAEPDDLLARGASTVVVTRGRAGALVRSVQGAAELEAARVVVVNPTGAGDAFFAGMLAGLVEGRDPVEAGRRGTEAAAIQLEGART